MSAKLIFVHALSPLHAGTGQGVGVIDLPIARERATNIPYLPGSSLKGTLRDLATESICTKQQKEAIFGPDTANAGDYAGAAQFSDQRLLLFPVRSLKGTFAWITSPYLLQRFARDAANVTLPEPLPIGSPPAPAEKAGAVSGEALVQGQQIVLEDLDLDIDTAQSAAVRAWATWFGKRLFPSNQSWQDYLTARFCVVHDDVLSFLLETATEITARIKLLESSKTVQQGGLWYEEALPTETILSGLLVANEFTKVDGQPRARAYETYRIIREMISKENIPRPVQLGGKATVGRGLCNVLLVD